MFFIFWNYGFILLLKNKQNFNHFILSEIVPKFINKLNLKFVAYLIDLILFLNKLTIYLWCILAPSFHVHRWSSVFSKWHPSALFWIRIRAVWLLRGSLLLWGGALAHSLFVTPFLRCSLIRCCRTTSFIPMIILDFMYLEVYDQGDCFEI